MSRSLGLTALAVCLAAANGQFPRQFLAPRQDGGHIVSSSFSKSWSWGSGNALQSTQTSQQVIQDGSNVKQTNTKKVCKDGACQEVTMVANRPSMQDPLSMPMHNRPLFHTGMLPMRMRAMLEHLMGPMHDRVQDTYARHQEPEIVFERPPQAEIVFQRPQNPFFERPHRPEFLMGHPPQTEIIIEPKQFAHPQQTEIIIGPQQFGRPMPGFGLPQTPMLSGELTIMPMGGEFPQQALRGARPPSTGMSKMPDEWTQYSRQFQRAMTDNALLMTACFALLFTLVCFSCLMVKELFKLRRSDARERPFRDLAEPLAPGPAAAVSIAKPAPALERKVDATPMYLSNLYVRAAAKSESKLVRGYMARVYKRVLG